MSTEDGLSQNSVFCISQDNSGFIWFGTDYGLNRFDGYNFISYFSDPKDSTSLSHNVITALDASVAGGIWIGTEGGGLNYFDPDQQTFSSYLQVAEDSNSLSSNDVTAVLEDVSGQLWIGTKHGLNQLNTQTGSITRYFKSDQLLDDHITCLYEFPEGTLWIGTKAGYLLKHDISQLSFLPIRPDFLKPDLDQNNFITQITADEQGSLWISMFLDGVYRYRLQTNRIKRFGMKYTDPDMVNIYVPFAIQTSQDGKVWIGSVDGLTRLNPTQNSFEFFRIESHNPYSVAGNTIKCLYTDKQKSLWIGTGNNGISHYSPDLVKFKHYKHSDYDPNSLSKNTVYAFTEDHDGNIWVGTSGGGLEKLNADGQTFTHYKWNTRSPEQWSHNFIMKLLCDRRNDIIWLGTWETGLFRFDLQTERFTNYHHHPEDSSSLGANRVISLLEDSEGLIWIGTSEKGLDVFDPVVGKFKHFTHHPEDPTSISGNTIYSLKEDSKGDIWIGSSDGGLCRYNYSSPSFTRFSLEGGSSDDLSSSDIRCLTIDQQGIIWIGTFGGGLIRFNPDTEESIRFKVRDGLPSNVIKGIVEDDSGAFWISTNKGLSKFDPDEKVFTNYTVENGLQGDEFRYESSLKSSRGELYFGGTNGFNSFRPEEIGRNTYQAPVVLTDILVNYQSMTRGSSMAQLPERSRAPHLLHDLQLSYADKVLAFEFAALDYSAPNKNRYAYRLAGFDNTWIQAGNQHQVTYTNLDPGSYTFEVKGSNSDGFWSNQTIELPIYIAAPFWETLWFRILAILTLSGIVFSVYKIRMNKLRTFEQHKAKEKEVLLQLDYQQRVLVTKSMDLIEKQEFMEEILDQLKALSLASEAERKAKTRILINKLTTLISFNHVWEEFEKWFTEIHSDYITNLRKEHPKLTSREIKLCALLRLNLMSKEIANLMNIEPASVDVQRYRIRKKMGLGKDENLLEYLSRF